MASIDAPCLCVFGHGLSAGERSHLREHVSTCRSKSGQTADTSSTSPNPTGSPPGCAFIAAMDFAP